MPPLTRCGGEAPLCVAAELPAAAGFALNTATGCFRPLGEKRSSSWTVDATGLTKLGGHCRSKRRTVLRIKSSVLFLTSSCHSTCKGGAGFWFPGNQLKPSRGSPSCHALQESPSVAEVTAERNDQHTGETEMYPKHQHTLKVNAGLCCHTPHCPTSTIRPQNIVLLSDASEVLHFDTARSCSARCLAYVMRDAASGRVTPRVTGQNPACPLRFLGARQTCAKAHSKRVLDGG